MSQTLPAFLLHTLKYVLFVHKKSTYFLGIVYAGELGCSVTLDTSSTNLILFSFSFFNLQIAEGQVQETEAQIISVSEIHETCHFLTSDSVVCAIPESIYSGNVDYLQAAHEANSETHQPPCFRGSVS